MQTKHETKADIAIISEPNKLPENDGWYGSKICIFRTVYFHLKILRWLAADKVKVTRG